MRSLPSIGFSTMRAVCSASLLMLLILVPATAQAQVAKDNGPVDQQLIALGQGNNLVADPFGPLPLPVRDGMVLIDAVASGDVADLEADLAGLGLQEGSTYGRVLSGWLPIGSIEALKSLTSLRSARPSLSTLSVGLTDSQGDAAMRSDAVRTVLGIDGTGITVGTLSDSYNCLGGAPADVASGDLPAGVTVLLDEVGCSSGSDEGRGMMQLIHDVAPGVAQAFHTAFGGEATFATGISDLATVAGADVIVDDVIYFAEPMFQDGIIAQAVDGVVASGVSYFSSAGNQDRRSYESPFVPDGGFAFGAFPPLTGFAPLFFGGIAHDFGGGDVFQSVTIPPGATLTVSFQWDQPFASVCTGCPGSASDYDIYILDDPPTGILNGSVSGNVGGDAVEITGLVNTGGVPLEVNIMLVQFFDPTPGAGLLKYVRFGSSSVTVNEFDTMSPANFGHSNAAGAEAVGAAYYDDTPVFGTAPPLVEDFSSAGSTPILFDITGAPVAPIIRPKPEITAPDGTNTTFFGSADPPCCEADGFPNFFGTSAAAPHAAAVAALLLEHKGGSGSIPPASVYFALESTAIDMDDPLTGGFDVGFDSKTGFGLINALPALGVFVVNTTADTDDGSCDHPLGTGSGNLDCTLREAINAANSAPHINFDMIGFDIPGPGPHVITPGSALPDITETVVIDGSTQPGNEDVCTLAIPLRPAYAIVLDGGGGAFTGLTISSGLGTVIRGLNIRNFGLNGLTSDSDGTIVECNFIGTNEDGTADAGNTQYGIEISEGTNLVGTDGDTTNDPGEGNLISGNDGRQVLITGADATANTVSGNFIGLTAAGTAVMAGNASEGIVIQSGADSNIIGGTGAGNVIAGNGKNIILRSSDNLVAANLIGTDASGTAAMPDQTIGILLDAAGTGNRIGGAAVASGNTISGHIVYGILMRLDDNEVQGNFIGTDAGGTVALPNGTGVLLDNAADNEIGGAAGARNLISGNTEDGVYIFGASSTGNDVMNNFIGTDVTGTIALPNGLNGVRLADDATGNFIGVAGPVAVPKAAAGWGDPGSFLGSLLNVGNLISGNTENGIFLEDGAGGNTISDNFIGTDLLGLVALPNSESGVRIETDGNTLTATGSFSAPQLISGNTLHGVHITGGATGNLLRGQSIGLDASGVVGLGNGANGIWIEDSPANRVELSFISGNGGHGILIDGVAAAGNFITPVMDGIGADFTTPVGNTWHGLEISDAPANAIGDGFSTFSANGQNGILISGADATGNIVRDSFIGLNGPLAPHPNGANGVLITGGANGNVIGDPALPSNIISANTLDGVLITGGGTTGNIIQSNAIGTDLSGSVPLPNGDDGVDLESAGSTVGGTGPGEGNTIAFNSSNGVEIEGAASTGNTVLSNSIFENVALGIDLENDGPTPNDPGDADGSPNLLQNTPEVTFAEIDGSGDLLVTYIVDSDPANVTHDLDVEFFEADVDEEEGETLVGTDTFTAADFAAGGKTVNLGAIAPSALLGTATDAAGNTSEFSVPRPILATTKTDAVSTGLLFARPGETITYTVELVNNGTSAAQDVELTDLPDANTTLTAGSGTITGDTGATFGYSGTFTATLDAPLPPYGGMVTITFEVTVNDPVPPSTDMVSNQGTFSGTNFTDILTDDPDDATSDTDPTVTRIVAIPDVMIAKMDAVIIDVVGSPGADPGDTIEYTAEIENKGNEGVADVVFSDTVDPNTSLDCGSVTTTKGSVTSCTGGPGGSLTVDIGTVDGAGGVDNPVTITFEVTVNDPFPVDVFEVENRGLVTGTAIADVLTDDPDTPPFDPTITPINAAELAIRKDLSGVTHDAGVTTLIFTITLTNNGPAEGTGIEVTDALPPEATFVSATPSQGTYDELTGLWTVGDLANGAS
ncbi:MAG: CSLREA domain-containing protein, partial [Rhodothermales bacterium]